MTKEEKREYDIKYRVNHPGYDKKRHKEYRLSNMEKIAIKDKIRKHEAYKKNPEKFKLKNNTWAENNPDKTKNRRLRRLYGITIEEYTQMFKKQKGVCAICSKEETSKHQNGKVKVLSVDHNHITGEIRQLLCNNCNVAIGLIGDNLPLVKKITNYLIKWQSNQQKEN
jgi:hypothetical protein